VQIPRGRAEEASQQQHGVRLGRPVTEPGREPVARLIEGRIGVVS
jgi:hypothetical protein